jgi:hypothetical protein
VLPYLHFLITTEWSTQLQPQAIHAIARIAPLSPETSRAIVLRGSIPLLLDRIPYFQSAKAAIGIVAGSNCLIADALGIEIAKLVSAVTENPSFALRPNGNLDASDALRLALAASSSQSAAELMVREGAISPLLSLGRSTPHPQIRELVVETVASIAHASPTTARAVFQANSVPFLLSVLTAPTTGVVNDGVMKPLRIRDGVTKALSAIATLPEAGIALAEGGAIEALIRYVHPLTDRPRGSSMEMAVATIQYIEQSSPDIATAMMESEAIRLISQVKNRLGDWGGPESEYYSLEPLERLFGLALCSPQALDIVMAAELGPTFVSLICNRSPFVWKYTLRTLAKIPLLHSDAEVIHAASVAFTRWIRDDRIGILHEYSRTSSALFHSVMSADTVASVVLDFAACKTKYELSTIPSLVTMSARYLDRAFLDTVVPGLTKGICDPAADPGYGIPVYKKASIALAAIFITIERGGSITE